MIILPTIDVEGVHGDRPFDQMVLGEVGDAQNWGVIRLARIFKRYGISATFFVDCYESTLWGSDRIEQICCELADLGQDVQLHTHPGWRDDSRDQRWLRRYKKTHSFLSSQLDFMAKLTQEQQIETIEAGIEMLQKWLGKKPIAHRSGGYSINSDTIHALRKTGILVDSSMNSAHSNSEVSWSHNRVVFDQGVLEIPVTVMYYSYSKSTVFSSEGTFGKLKKTDLNVCSDDDLIAYVNDGKAHGVKVMNFFMHSYSLLKYDHFLSPTYSKFEPDKYRLKVLENFLSKMVDNSDVSFMSMQNASDSFRDNPELLIGTDYVPAIYSPATLALHARNKINRKLSETWCRVTGINRLHANRKAA